MSQLPPSGAENSRRRVLWEPLLLALQLPTRQTCDELSYPSALETGDPARGDTCLRDLGYTPSPAPTLALLRPLPATCSEKTPGRGGRVLGEGLALSAITWTWLQIELKLEDEGASWPYVCRRPRGWRLRVRGRLCHPLTLRPDICFSDARLCPGPSTLGRPQALSVPALGQWFVPPYHGRQAGNVFDRILDLLFGHLDQRAVLVLRWQRLRPVPRDPGVQLQRMTGGVRGRCSWLPEAGERSQGRDAGTGEAVA